MSHISVDCWQIIVSYAVCDKDTWDALSLVNKHIWKLLEQLRVSYKRVSADYIPRNSAKIYKCIEITEPLNYYLDILMKHKPTHLICHGRNNYSDISLPREITHLFCKCFDEFTIHDGSGLQCVMFKNVHQIVLTFRVRHIVKLVENSGYELKKQAWWGNIYRRSSYGDLSTRAICKILILGALVCAMCYKHKN